MIDIERMKGLAAAAGVPLNDRQLAQLDEYARQLVAWNQRMNLTAITQPREIEEKHFLDCLLLAAQPEVTGRLVDVGSGAGFPGLVVKVARPALAVTLMEPTGKRCTFLQAAAAAMGLAVEVEQQRAEEAARKQWREAFDVATARAVAALPVLCEYCLPLVRPGGWLIAMKGAEDETAGAQNALQKLGGQLAGVRRLALSGGAQRSLVVIKKVAATPSTYPRAGGVIKKRPL